MAVDFTKFGFFSDKNRDVHQNQEKNTMNTPSVAYQAPASGAMSAHSATNDLTELAAVNGVNVLTTFAKAHGQNELEIKVKQ